MRDNLVGPMMPVPTATYPARGASRNHSFVRIDLRPLQRAGVIHVAYFGLRVELVHLPPAFAVTVPGLLHAAERQMRFRPDGGRVDIGDAVVQLLHRPKAPLHVAGIDRAGEAVT